MPSFHSRNVGWASKTLLELVSRCLLPPVTCRPSHLTLLERPRAPPPRALARPPSGCRACSQESLTGRPLHLAQDVQHADGLCGDSPGQALVGRSTGLPKIILCVALTSK